MMKPCEEFTCDVCGDLITDLPMALLVFKDDADRKHYDLKIIHKGRCDRDSRSLSLGLDGCVGPVGLSKLLTWIHVGDVVDRGRNSPVEFSNNVEFAEIFKRLQIPYYEEARQFFLQAESEGYLDGNAYGNHNPETLKMIIEKFSDNEREE